MSKRIAPLQEQALGEQLRREAREAWPDHDETIHHRIITAVRRRAEQPPSRMPIVARWRGRLAAAFAAACLLIAVVLGWQLTQRGPRQNGIEENAIVAVNGPPKTWFPPDVVESTMAKLPLVDGLADPSMDDLDTLIISAAIAPHSADLEHDARLAVETLLERLPISVELVAGL
jgi:hypothetical protein